MIPRICEEKRDSPGDVIDISCNPQVETQQDRLGYYLKVQIFHLFVQN